MCLIQLDVQGDFRRKGRCRGRVYYCKTIVRVRKARVDYLRGTYFREIIISPKGDYFSNNESAVIVFVNESLPN